MISASDVKPDLTILADVAANVFAVCLLILLALLALGSRPRQVQAPAGPVEARAALDVVEREPLGARALIAQLQARLAVEGGLAVDLLPGRTLIVRDGQRLPDDGPAALATALRAADASRPVRLFVFDAGGYGAAIATLRARRRAFTEMSVPRALRRADGADWSAAFVALAPQAGNAERFRDGLARLLGGASTPAEAGAGGSAGGVNDPASLGARLGAALSRLAAFAVPILALVAVLLIESRERRRLA